MRHRRPVINPFVFRWEPGTGPNLEALTRFKSRSPEPRFPMGEAWFMGERRIFDELKGADPSFLPIDELEKVLWEIGSGTCAFGPFDEWWEWFHYLLPSMIPRLSETHAFTPLIEPVLTAFFALHPTGIIRAPDDAQTGIEPFRRDLLATLGQFWMDHSRWQGGEPTEVVIESFGLKTGEGRCNWNLGGGAFGGLVLFCWKYLNPDEIEPWVRSIFEIRSSHFRAQWMAWLLGAFRIVTGSVTTFSQLDRYSQHLGWDGSHILSRHFLFEDEQPIPLVPETNRVAFEQALRKLLTEATVLEWIDGFARFDYLETALGQVPDQFIAHFFSKTPGDRFYVG